MNLRVLIADDHRIFRESLSCMLNLDPDLTVVATAGSGEEALSCAEEIHPDVVCMDVMMPGINGIDATKRLLAAQPDVKVIGLSAYADRRYVLEMLNAGARGYVTKSEAPDELRNAIHSVCEEQLYFCPEVASTLFDPMRVTPPSEPGHSLRFNLESQEVKQLLTEMHQATASIMSQPPASEEFLRLRQIIDGSMVPSFVIDQKHCVTHWNKACEMLTGVTTAEIVGTSDHWRAFYSEQRPVMADLILDGAIDTDLERHFPTIYHKSVLIEGAYEAEDFFPRIGEAGSWIYLTAAPLYDSEKNIIGSISTLQDFTARRRAEAALKESEARYRTLSITDNLTGLFNSRHFYDQLKTEISRAIRYGHPLSIMLMDVDNFKQYNDTYGHFEGDKVLKKLAEIIRNIPRVTDSGYRIGGEEFAVLLPDTDIENAQLVAERLRATFAAQQFSPNAGKSVFSSVSIGVTRYQPYEEFSTFIQRADAASYEAKHQGKNRVVVA